MVKFRLQNAGQNHDLPLANKSFVTVTKFKYFGKRVTNQNFIDEEIRSRLSSGKVCKHPDQNLLFLPSLL
jgi:hypothetical protein